MKKSTTKSKVKRIFEQYRTGLITLGRVIAELQKIHSETVLKQFKQYLLHDEADSLRDSN